MNHPPVDQSRAGGTIVVRTAWTSAPFCYPATDKLKEMDEWIELYQELKTGSGLINILIWTTAKPHD